MIEIPHLDDDVHDLAGLRRMDEYLFLDGRREVLGVVPAPVG